MMRLPPAARALIAIADAILGLAPQALRRRPLRGLSEATGKRYQQSRSLLSAWPGPNAHGTDFRDPKRRAPANQHVTLEGPMVCDYWMSVTMKH